MIKFKHKKHMYEDKGSTKIVIYYNISDLFLGTALMILVVFFIHDYLSHRLDWGRDSLPQNYTYATSATRSSLQQKP